MYSKSVTFYLIFRTDQGVHAFKSSAHVDLNLPYSCHPSKLVFQVNNFLSSCDVPIKYDEVFLYFNYYILFEKIYKTCLFLYIKYYYLNNDRL